MVPVSVMKLTGRKPKRPMRSLTTPSVGDSAAMKMPAMTTQERKCGKYIADWTNLRSEPARSSLSNSATMIGTGKTNRIFMPEMIRVLAST
jgi:hypothetical protein